MLLARGVLIMTLGVGANVVLARLLAPRDFGLVALGSVLVVFGSFVSDTGLGAGLIRRIEPPTLIELEAVNGVQIGVAAGLTLVACTVAVFVGRDGWVVAIMVASLLVTVLKTPSSILLERRLEYGKVATVDISEAGAFYLWSLLSVALGAGVWGFASAMVVRAATGAMVMLRIGGLGRLRPRWSWQLTQPLFAFGVKLQTALLVGLIRDQSLNVGIAAIAGVATLGVWNLAWRVLQLPLMVFANLNRVGYPAMARILEAGQDPRPIIERGGAALAVLGSAVIVALVGFAPGLPTLLGPGWNDVPEILLWSGGALVVSSPMLLATVPYLFAAGCAGTVVRAACLSAVVWLGTTLPLLNVIGPRAAGIGWCAAILPQTIVLCAAASARTRATVLRSVGAPAAIGVGALLSAWFAALGVGRTIPGGLVGAAVGEAALLLALLALRRPALRDTQGFVALALRRVTGRTGTAVPEWSA